MTALLAMALRAVTPITASDGRPAAPWKRLTAAALLSLGLVVLFAQTGGLAQTQDALPYSTGYLITGNYVVGGVVDLDTERGLKGFRTGTIPMRDVPQNADILAAFLYWETISPNAPPQSANGVKFRGVPITAVKVKSASKPLTGQTAACFDSDRGGLTLSMFRADVLRLLPLQNDASGNPTGKRLVNDADLRNNGLPLNTVTLPKSGPENVRADTAGASLFVVYRDPTQPLTKIVVYDGLYLQPSGAPMTQTLRGFYESSAAKSAKITHIVGSDERNQAGRLFFNGSLIATNPFPEGPKFSHRGWTNRTFDVSSLMSPISNPTGYGETATTTVDHTKNEDHECLTWAAIIFSTAVKDVDHDGLPDGLEDAVLPLKDPPNAQNPNGQPLPDLHGMGASSAQKDLFVEVNGMRTDVPTTYGSQAAPYNSTVTTVTAPPHNHMPTPEVLKIVGETFDRQGIKAHFDVGNIDTYHLLESDYASRAADGYLVPSHLARGGESLKEASCDRTKPFCQFPDYPGTVGWKVGFQLDMFAPLDPNTGQELTGQALKDAERVCDAGGPCWRRFDKSRNGLFHYVLYAHSRGKAKSPFPCLDANGSPTAFTSGGLCASPAVPNPEYHVPTGSSGVADLPGGHALVSLGRWDNFVGTPYIRAATTVHELGHNFELWHGGAPATFNDTTKTRVVEPNCKPNYPSVMSYLFQVHGLLKDDLSVSVDFSGSAQSDLHENALSDGPLSGLYRAAWYAPVLPPGTPGFPAGNLGYLLGTPATKYCSGASFSSTPPSPAMARIDASATFDSIDWDGSGLGNTSGAQDVNFDGRLNGTLRGFDDWAHLRLDQTGSARNMVSLSLGGQDFGGQDFGGQDFGGQDFGGQDFGGQDFGGQDFGGVDFDGQDFGGQDFGGQDFGGQELDDITAKALGSTPPNELRACVQGSDCPAPQPAPGTTGYHRVQLRWKTPNVGSVSLYHVYRVTGDAVTSTTAPVEVGTTSGTTLVDNEELPNGRLFTYFVKADFTDGTHSPASNSATITAVNDPPVALAEGFTTNEDTPLTTGNVLDNDTDDDSNHAGLRAVIVSPPLHAKSFTLNADGSFSYAPLDDFETSPTDTFTYKTNDGRWSGDPSVMMSLDSNEATVTITVVSRHTITTLSSTKAPSVYGDSPTFTAIVAPVSPQLGTPKGTVIFKDGTTTLGTGTLAGGQATFDTSTLPALLDAGTHSITAVYCGDTAHVCAPDTVFYGSTSDALGQVVQKAHLTVTADDKTRKYGEANPSFTGTVSGFVVGQTLGTSGVSGSASCTSAATVASPVPGPYDITCTTGTLTANNYDFPTFVTGHLTITKATPTVSVAFTPSGVTYDGNAHGAVATVAGVNDTTLHDAADGTVTINYTKNGSPVEGTPTDAGSYTASAHFTSTNGNYNNADTTSDAILAIAKANATVTVNAFTGIYDGTAHGATGTATGVGGANLAAGLNLGATFTNAPGGTANWTFAGGANYSDQSGTAAIVINKANATITVTPYAVTYDAAAHTATGSATGVSYEPLSGLDLSGTTHIDAGDYPADPWTFGGNTNYNATGGAVHDAIAASAVIATAGSGASTFDGTAKSPSACTVTGLVTGGLGCANNPPLVGPGAGTTVITPVVTGIGLTNFTITPVTGSFTIGSAPTTTTFAAAPAPTSGGSFTLAASSNSGGAAITYSVVSGPCAVVDAGAGTFTSSAAGTCVVKADSAATANYQASSAQQTVVISSALSIIDAQLVDGFESSRYPPSPQALSASGGTGLFTWTIDPNAQVRDASNQLVPAIPPPGLSLDAQTGIISGTPTTPGSFAFRVVVTDSHGQTAAHNFCIHIDPNLVASLVTKDFATGGETALSLATSLLDPDAAGVVVSNPRFAGSPLALGSFTGGGSATQGVGFDRGIILSSGAISGAKGPNNSTSNTVLVGSQPGDADLKALAGNVTASFDAATLEFDFTPTCHEGTTCAASFEYVFGSDEYPEFVGSQFNDVFGFFLTDVTAGGVKKNYAVLPGTTTPVSINNVNGRTNSQFFRLNNTGALNVQADGLTTPLQFSAPITSGHTYHIKIGISDIGDTSFDSWVFIKSGSFKVTHICPIVVQ